MQYSISRVLLFIGLIYILFTSTTQLFSDVLFPQAKRSIEQREQRKQQREERRKYKEDIKKAVQDLKDLSGNECYSVVRDVVLRVRKAIDAYNCRYDKPILTRSRFRDQFKMMLLVKRANDKDWNKSRHALRRYQRRICAIMFPEHPKSIKYNFYSSCEEKHDEEISTGAALARDIGWCAAGTALLCVPSKGIKNLGWGMISTGSYGVCCTVSQVMYHYEQKPATQEEIDHMRQSYQDRHRQCEPFYYLRVEE